MYSIFVPKEHTAVHPDLFDILPERYCNQCQVGQCGGGREASCFHGQSQLFVSHFAQIETRQIFATINQKDGMVSFSEDPEEYDTARMAAILDNKIQKTISLAQKVRTVDESIASSPQYLQRVTTVYTLR